MTPPDQERAFRPADLPGHAWVVLQEALGSFIQNAGLRQASSLAFYSTLALIPALLLLTFLMSVAIGSSQAATQKTAELVGHLIPRSGEVILKEVASLSSHPRTAGTLNLLVLAWSLTPLVSCLREIMNGIFKARNPRNLLVSKLLDLAVGMLFLTGLAALAGAGVFLHFLGSLSGGLHIPFSFRFLPFWLTILLVWGVYFAFTSRVSARHLLAGAVATTALWFTLRPAFTLFLTHDPGYGFAFGSFKSIFIVVIWIYYSLAVLLFGAEVAAALHRGETLLLRRLMEGKRGLPVLVRNRMLMDAPPGWVFFREGEPGVEMFFVLTGTVSLCRDGREVARVRKGHYFGEASFLLGEDRPATAVALEPCRCVIIHGENFETLLLEFPGIVREMLGNMARLLRDRPRGDRAHPRPARVRTAAGLEK